jgi:beta-glucosidase-like glycosyl hydrolase
MNFAPVVDANNNPQNPVINDRSFGEVPENVAAKGLAFARGLQQAGIIAAAKHFPGHGDTVADSHETLPKIPHDLPRLQSTELLPFKRLIDGGVDAVMTAHLYVPALDPRENRPTSLSSAVVTGLLRRQMGFEGLIITDALQMKAVRNHFKPGDESLEAALAGNDVLLLGSIDDHVDPVLEKHLPEGIRKIWLAVEDGRLSAQELDRRVLRILKMKEALGLHEDPHLGSKDPGGVIDHPKTRALRAEILDAAVTMVKNDGGLLPLRGAVGAVAYVNAGVEGGKMSKLLSLASENPLERTLSAQLNLKKYRLTKNADETRLGKLVGKLENDSTVIVSISGMKRWPSQNFGVTDATRNLLQRLDAKGKKVVLVVMGNPYSLRDFEDQAAILCAYEDSQEARIAAARVILGELSPRGRLPVTASERFPAGTGLSFP